MPARTSKARNWGPPNLREIWQFPRPRIHAAPADVQGWNRTWNCEAWRHDPNRRTKIAFRTKTPTCKVNRWDRSHLTP